MQKSKKRLTNKQEQILPYIVSCSTLGEAAKKVSITQKQLCEWFRQPAFKTEVRRLQDDILENAVASLKQTTTKAVQVLADLLNSEDEKIRRGCANDILSHVAKFRELQELESRIEALEQKTQLEEI